MVFVEAADVPLVKSARDPSLHWDSVKIACSEAFDSVEAQQLADCFFVCFETRFDLFKIEQAQVRGA